MYKFIDEIKDENERIKQIRLQSSKGFDGYFNKCMIQDLLLYQELLQKCCFKIITPEQSVLAYAKESHERVCNTVLEAIYKRDFQRKTDKIKYNDVENNMKLGNIYIKIHDTDISLNDNSKKRSRPDDSSLVYIFIPKNFNKYQFEELKKSISTIKKYDDNFIKQAYGIIHYLDYDLDERVCYVDNGIYEFLGDKNNPGIAKDYIKDIQILPEEEIIISQSNIEIER